MLDRDLSITPSILDRLIDLEPGNQNEPPASRFQSLSELKNSVRRDVEALLNTRIPIYSIDENLEEIRRSVATFGLPDFTATGITQSDEQARMTSTIQKAIETFEPRFVGVRVFLEPVDSLAKQVRFRIEANLNIEPSPEPVVFDTVLQSGNSAFTVQEK
jgi:type VI secretion system protein ImpF